MIIHKFIAIVSIVFICSMSGYAQSSYSCPDNATHPKNDSQESLEYFLTSNDKESHRIIINLNNLQNSPIETLSGSSYSCHKLNDYKSEYITGGPDKNYTYYKVSNYYFIVSWYSVNSTGYRGILIFDDDYNLHGYASL